MTSREQFCLRLKDYESDVRSAWRDYQNLNEFCDVTLACTDKQIDVHKVIISTCSPVFKNIFKTNSNRNPLIYLAGVKSRDLVNLVDFMYQGEVNIVQDELDGFLAVAEDLKIKGLDEDKNKSYEKKLQTDNQSKNDYYKNQTRESENDILYPMVQNSDSMKELNEYEKQLDNYFEPHGPQNSNVQYNIQLISDKGIQETVSKACVECLECGKLFANLNNLRTHTESKHRGISYSCEKCDYKAPQKSTLKRHMKGVHEGITYPCAQCDYKATQAGNLTTHCKKYHNC